MTALSALFRSLPSGLTVSELRDRIYRQGFARPAGSPALGKPAAEDLVRKLSAANQGHDAWIPGWRVEEARPDGTALLSRGGLRHGVRAGDYVLTFSEDLLPRPGYAATLRHRRESLTLQAGVYYAFGDTLPEPEDQGNAIRLYFHAAQESAVPVFAILTHELNALGVPFTLKTMLRPEEGDRADATLLYLPPRRFPAFAAVLRQSSESLGDCLEPQVPLFTRPLAPGIGLAESPGGGESFGMHRCRLVAEGIVEAWNAGDQDEASLQESVRRRFAAEGLSLDRPYLNPGGVDVYALENP